MVRLCEKSPLPVCKVIFFSAYVHPTIVKAAHDAGGSGYLVKPTPIQELIKAIHKVSKGERLPFPLQIRSKPDHEDIWKRLNLLTPREIEIVHWRSRGFTNQNIGRVMDLSEKRIKNLVTRIFQKTRTSRMEEAIALLYRVCVKIL